MNKAVAAVLTCISLSACAPHIATHEELVQSVVKSTLKVGVEMGHGTGFYIKVLGNDYAITNQHVCAIFDKGFDPTQYLQDYQGTRTSDFSILKEDDKVDLCAIKFHHFQDMIPLDIALGNHYQQEVLVVGYPMYNPLIPSFGFTSDTQDDTLHPGNRATFISAEIFPGNSGSPVVDMSGKLVGVISEGDMITHRGLIVTLEHLQTFVMGLL